MGLRVLRGSSSLGTVVRSLVAVLLGVPRAKLIVAVAYLLVARCRLLVRVGISFIVSAIHEQGLASNLTGNLLLWRKAQRTQLVLQILQLGVELLFFAIKVLQDVVDLAAVTASSHLAAPLLLLELPQAFLVPV